MRHYNNAKPTDLYFMYGAMQGNEADAQMMYIAPFPIRNLPDLH